MKKKLKTYPIRFNYLELYEVAYSLKLEIEKQTTMDGEEQVDEDLISAWEKVNQVMEDKYEQ
tara:strand:+ start:1167 stop:1352 length:186 start_codon:yes stop_codon:yes gene_type:complete